MHIALSWAVAARNSLHNHNGFSPNQLVFGKNPAFPNVLDCDPPAHEIPTVKIIIDNQNARDAAWQGHTCRDANERIRRALLHQVREDNVAQLKNGECCL